MVVRISLELEDRQRRRHRKDGGLGWLDAVIGGQRQWLGQRVQRRDARRRDDRCVHKTGVGIGTGLHRPALDATGNRDGDRLRADRLERQYERERKAERRDTVTSAHHAAYGRCLLLRL